ncbi:hypothetical protein [Methylomicrobium sp. wino1]|uniref:hypothetical protein n=1 Tax=Methylotuvimicrobium sp. TaxID=2822413 RepID=UPI000F6525BB
MAIFRNLTLQRLLCLMFLVTALLSHTQILFACEKMHGKPKLVCCCDEAMSEACPMIDACAMQENLNQDQCCEVTQDSLTEVVMTHGSSTAELLTLLLDSPQPPPTIGFQEFFDFLTPKLLSAAPPFEPFLLVGNRQIFLRTLRLRL